MTFADWFSPRIDGTLHWQQSLALSIAVVIVLGPVGLWWRYEAQPAAAAREAVEYVLGPDSRFQVAEIFNEVDRRGDLLPVRTYAETLVCGSAAIEGRRTVVAVLARTRSRGGVYDAAVISPERPETWRYPGIGPSALEICAKEVGPVI